MSNSSIMSVREMIDAAFGEADANVVNFKLIQAILLLLARQLRILERNVRIQLEIELDRDHPESNLSVTELKIHATVPKKKRRITKSAASRGGFEIEKKDKLAVQRSKSKPIFLEKSSSEKSFEKSTSKSTERSTQDKSSTTKSTSDKTSSEKTKTSTITSTDKTSSSKKSSSTKESSDKSGDKTTSSDNTTTGATTTTSSDKTASGDKTASSDKTASGDKTTSSSKTTSSDKTKSGDKTTSGDKNTSSDKTTSGDKTTSSGKTTSGDKTTSSGKSTSSDKTTTSEKTTSYDKTTSSDKTTSGDKTTSTSKKSSSGKDASDKTSRNDERKKGLKSLLEQIEEQREKELRIIHQRADSRDVGEKSPTPMASLDSVEEQYEKLLVVERIPADSARYSTGKRTPQLSIVTQDQFEALANVVRDLQGHFAPIAKPDFPDNVQLMQDLRKGASLTDAMAALQLSARLEAAEKTLHQMMGLVTDLAVKSGIDTESVSKGMPGLSIVHEATTTSTPVRSRTSKKSIVSKPSKQSSKSTSAQPKSVESVHVLMPSSESNIEIVPTPISVPAPEEEKLDVPVDWITYDDLDNAIHEVIDGLLKTMTGLTTRSNANAENAIKIAKNLEDRLDSSLNLGNRMNDLELLVSEYSEQINILDTSLSSQMTNYQEQLTQMQHDLEAGLEAMAEALANTGGDTVAVAELNAQFTNFQADLDISHIRQKELMESQNALSHDLQALWQQIELLREIKSDRDEVADALRDKAGLGELNGLVTLQQFHAVRGDFEKRIGAAYDKFNNQEITWQKAIDDLLRELNDKADWVQLVALRDDVNKILNKLRSEIQAMLDIVGEPRAAAITKKLFRDAACLSCSTPANMNLEETETVPKLPAFPLPSTRPPTIGAEDSLKPAEDGNHKICYPGLPIPHPRDPRSHICQRWCGGSHTVITDKKSRAPVGMIISPALRRVTTAVGADGRTYMVEEVEPIRKPCIPCNEKKLNTPEPSELEMQPAPAHEDFDSDMTPVDFQFCSVAESKDMSITPPPPIEDF